MPGDAFLSIAGLTIAVRSADGEARWTWDEPVSRFLVDPRPADVVINVERASARSLPRPEGRATFDSGAVWKLHRHDGGYRIDCTSEAFGAEPYKTAFFDDSFTRGTIHMRVPGLNPLDYPLDEVLVANLLGRGRGVELHSCGIIDEEGRGRLFVGVSGAGKSTTARLWEGRTRGIVSDDRVIVREHDGAMWMYGTPWHGEAALSMPGRVPLSGVYLLAQAPANALVPLTQAEAVARLFRCTFPLFYDGGALDFTLSFLERLAARVPVRELQFARDPKVVELVLS